MPRPNVGEIPFVLGEDLQRVLASLVGMPPAAAEASVGLLPLGDRMRLAGYGIIDAEPDRPLAEAGWPSDFVVTADGWRVIALCAEQWPARSSSRRPKLAEGERQRLVEELDGVLEEIFEREPERLPNP
jgi:predicted acyltransferase